MQECTKGDVLKWGLNRIYIRDVMHLRVCAMVLYMDKNQARSILSGRRIVETEISVAA